MKKNVIILSLISVLFLFFIYTKANLTKNNNNDDELYDTVVIGAGITGLFAANELAEQKIIILEKEERIGGRVFTDTINSNRGDAFPIDMGAVFAFPSEYLPEGIEVPNLLKKNENVGIYYGKSLYLGNTILSILKDMKEEHSFINEIFSEEQFQIENKSLETQRFVNGLFQLIHPGNINLYDKRYHFHSFATYKTPIYSTGNRFVVDFFAEKLGERIKKNSEVLQIKDKKDFVEITYNSDGYLKKIKSKYVIVSTDANVAKKILGEASGGVPDVEYGRFVVVASLIRKKMNFSYIVTPDSYSSVLMNYPLDDKEYSIILTYFTEKSLEKDIDEKFFESESTKILEELKIIDESTKPEKVKVKIWKKGGNIISQNLLSVSRYFIKATERVFVAGDYAYYQKDERPFYDMPYGFLAAARSGKKSGEEILKILKKEKNSVDVLEDNSKSCVRLKGFSITNLPNDRTREVVKLLRPEIFGIVSNNDDYYVWLNSFDFVSNYGYKPKIFFGSRSFDLLKSLKKESIKNIDVLGYCPRKNDNISYSQVVQAIKTLKKIYKDKEISVGVCYDLFSNIEFNSFELDYLGIEIIAAENSVFLDGKYDETISKVREDRGSLIGFISISDVSSFNEEQHKEILNKLLQLKLDPGYSIVQSPEILSFLKEHFCHYNK